MYERFTDAARLVMRQATSEAERLQFGLVESGHILLGLLKTGTFVGVSALKNLQADVKAMCLEAERALARESLRDLATKRPALSPRAKAIIEYAIAESRRMNHDYVGTEHLLLGLLRDEEGIGARILINRGFAFEKVFAEILNVLGHSHSG